MATEPQYIVKQTSIILGPALYYTGERWSPCQYCAKRFTKDEAHLFAHRNTHSLNQKEGATYRVVRVVLKSETRSARPDQVVEPIDISSAPRIAGDCPHCGWPYDHDKDCPNGPERNFQTPLPTPRPVLKGIAVPKPSFASKQIRKWLVVDGDWKSAHFFAKPPYTWSVCGKVSTQDHQVRPHTRDDLPCRECFVAREELLADELEQAK